jgi:hypothetical protein
MIHIKRKIIVKMPVKDVWKVLFEDFTKVGNWVTGVYSSRPGTKEEGYDRVCTTFTGKLYEKIINKDETNHSFEINAEGLPFFVNKFRGTWSLKDISPKTTEAIFEINIHLKGIIGAIMKYPTRLKLTKGLDAIEDDLKSFVETGTVSSSKKKELKK